MITLLTGLNRYAIGEAVRFKTEAFSGEAESYDAAELDPKNLPDLFMGASLFAAQRLIVIKNPSANKSLWTELEPWIGRASPESDILLVDSAPDKRTKTYKQLQKHGTITEHKELQDHELVNWLQSHARARGTDLTLDVARYFISYVGHDQWRLVNEFDKLLLADQPFSQKLIQDIAEPYPEATAFELLDALFAGSADKVTELLSLLRQREDPYQFLGLLSSQVFGLLAVVSGGSRRPDEIAKDMGLHPFVIRKLSTAGKRLGKQRVGSLVDRLAHADESIKTSGVDPWRQLEITLLSGI